MVAIATVLWSEMDQCGWLRGGFGGEGDTEGDTGGGGCSGERLVESQFDVGMQVSFVSRSKSAEKVRLGTRSF